MIPADLPFPALPGLAALSTWALRILAASLLMIRGPEDEWPWSAPHGQTLRL